jgi:hypothetical protein
MGWIKRQILEHHEGPKCVESMLGNFLKKHDINLPIHLRIL